MYISFCQILWTENIKCLQAVSKRNPKESGRSHTHSCWLVTLFHGRTSTHIPEEEGMCAGTQVGRPAAGLHANVVLTHIWSVLIRPPLPAVLVTCVLGYITSSIRHLAYSRGVWSGTRAGGHTRHGSWADEDEGEERRGGRRAEGSYYKPSLNINSFLFYTSFSYGSL